MLRSLLVPRGLYACNTTDSQPQVAGLSQLSPWLHQAPQLLAALLRAACTAHFAGLAKLVQNYMMNLQLQLTPPAVAAVIAVTACSHGMLMC
jgi:hypothetical protein